MPFPIFLLSLRREAQVGGCFWGSIGEGEGRLATNCGSRGDVAGDVERDVEDEVERDVEDEVAECGVWSEVEDDVAFVCMGGKVWCLVGPPMLEK